MAEIGIDISARRSKYLHEFLGREMDLVVTVCDNARKSCPFFLAAMAVEHESFPDPTSVVGSEEE